MKNVIMVILAMGAFQACTTTQDYKLVSKQLAKPGFNVIDVPGYNAVCYIYKDDDDDVVVAMQCDKKDQFQGLKVNATISN